MVLYMKTDLQVVVMTISYSHDIATALLASSGAALWMLDRHYPSPASPGAERYFLKTFSGITRLAAYSLIWILAAGVPRVLFYREYEWADAAGDLQIVAIVIKHVVMFLLVGFGIFYWAKLGKRAKQLQHNESI